MTNQFTVEMPEPEIERLRVLAAQQQQALEEFAAEQLRTIARETKNGAGNVSNGHHPQENVVRIGRRPTRRLTAKRRPMLPCIRR